MVERDFRNNAFMQFHFLWRLLSIRLSTEGSDRGVRCIFEYLRGKSFGKSNSNPVSLQMLKADSDYFTYMLQ